MAEINPDPLRLPYDLLVHVLDMYSDHYPILARCALVNWEFNHAASRLLYSRVVLKPEKGEAFYLGDVCRVPENSNLPSALLERNVNHVVTLEVSGYLSSRVTQSNALRSMLLDALHRFVNLQSVSFTPASCHEDLFSGLLESLKSLPMLRELTVSASCANEANAPVLVGIGELEQLTLYDPTRAILQLLPGWLGRLGGTLTELHLRGNCGSVTPGVLKSFVPHVSARLRAFSLGLSYSLTDEDVFTFLGQLPMLKRVELRYYWQMKTPPTQPPLRSLTHLVVKYQCTESKEDAVHLCKWIRRAIASSPIEDIRLVSDHGMHIPAAPSFSSIVEHLTKKHCATLRYLDMRTSYVGVDALKELFVRCTGLEESHVAAREGALSDFVDLAGGLGRLRAAGFYIQNVKHGWRVDTGRAEKIMRSCASLRELTVNGEHWEGSWVSSGAGEVDFFVRKVPWRTADSLEE